MDPGVHVFEGPPLHRFRVEIDPEPAQALRRDRRAYVPARFSEGTNAPWLVGVRLTGHSTFEPLDRRPNLALKFNHLVPGQTYHGLTKLFLHNSRRDPSVLREWLGGELFRQAGVPAPRAAHARVELNGRDLGLYALVEPVNQGFLRRHFGDDTGNLYEGTARDIDRPLEQDNGSVTNQVDRLALAAVAQEADPLQRWAKLPAVLDVDRFVAYLALETLIGQYDGYTGTLYGGTIERRTVDGKSLLTVTATNALCQSSWRRQVILEPGRYAFTGKVKVQGIAPAKGVGKAGAALYWSGHPPAGRVIADSDWTEMTCDLDVPAGGAELELICEYRAMRGEAWFDPDSLVLIRK